VEDNLGVSEKVDLFSIIGTIVSVPHFVGNAPWYRAPRDKEIHAKVVRNGSGGWYCAKNDKTYGKCRPRCEWSVRVCLCFVFCVYCVL